MTDDVAANCRQPPRDASMPKHIEAIVMRMPIRDADRAQGPQAPSTPGQGAPPLMPVSELSDLAPHQRIAELRSRVLNGVYHRREIVEAVARVLVSGGSIWD